MSPYDPRHYRFSRSSGEYTPVIERWDAAPRLRWAVIVALATVALLALVLPA